MAAAAVFDGAAGASVDFAGATKSSNAWRAARTASGVAAFITMVRMEFCLAAFLRAGAVASQPRTQRRSAPRTGGRFPQRAHHLLRVPKGTQESDLRRLPAFPPDLVKHAA